MDKVRVGIVGIGNIGSAHAKKIYNSSVSTLSLKAICDINLDRLDWAKENFTDVDIYDDYSDMLENADIDAVIVSTPHYLHPQMAIDAFKSNYNVLSEKPAGVCAEDIQQIEDVAKSVGKLYAIMFNQRTDPLFIKTKEIIESGRLGNVQKFMWNITNWYRTQAYYNSSDWRATWAGEGGGVLMNQAPHNLDIWQWLIGVPDRLRAFLYYGKYHNIEVEDDATLYGEYDNGATALFVTSTGEYPGTNRLEISGDRGKIVLENGNLKFFESSVSQKEQCYIEETFFPNWEIAVEEYNLDDLMKGNYWDVGHLAVLENFGDAILNGKELVARGIEGLNSLSIANASYISDWNNNQWVKLPLDTKFSELLEEKCKNSKKKVEGKGSSEGSDNYSDRWQVNW